MIELPFLIQRFKPEVKIRVINDSKDRCYFCEKRIKHERGYYEFHRKYDEDSHPMRYACHRVKCHINFGERVSSYGYKNIKRYTAWPYTLTN